MVVDADVLLCADGEAIQMKSAAVDQQEKFSAFVAGA